MNKLMERLFLSTAFMFVFLNAFAQDPQLSQFYASPIYTNPAFAGAAKKIRIATNARNQYTKKNHSRGPHVSSDRTSWWKKGSSLDEHSWWEV